jgi:uncharacterized protein (TIGR03083 family)
VSGLLVTEKQGWTGGPGAVIEGLGAQRRHTLALARDLTPDEWAAPSRCTEWTVHEVLRHMRDTQSLLVARLEHTPRPFPVRDIFDPRTTPAKWLTFSEGQSPAETLAELEDLAERERAAAQAFSVYAGDDETMWGVLGREQHWSVHQAHLFWEAWVHERDVTVPLGRATPPASPGTLRIMASYALMAAATPAAHAGEPIDVTVVLDGAPDPAYRLLSRDDELVVEVVEPPAGAPRGPLEAVADSLAGRGPAPAEVLGADTPQIALLSRLRAVAT